MTRAARASRTARGCVCRRRATPDIVGGRTGDLYVDVHVQPHPLLRREGDDLLIVVPVAVHEAMLGARIERADARRAASASRSRRRRRRVSGSG